MKSNLWKSVSVIGASALLLSSSIDAKSTKDPAPEVIPGEFIVKMRGGLFAASAENLIAQTLRQTLGATGVRSINSLAMDSRIQKVVLRDPRTAAAALDTLRANPNVKYVEPNYVYRAFDLPNDTEFKKQWDMNNEGQPDSKGQVGTPGSDVHVTPIWARGITGSKAIKVAVIDTGIDYLHPDLKDNIYENPGEAGDLATNGIDDDGNGIIDDVHGANFVAGAMGTNQSRDDHDHGTHCAGTIGAKGNNAIGLTGVNWDVSLVPVKFLSADGSGSSEGAINSIKYATKMKVNVMSNSWGGGPFSAALKEAIEEANAAGILFVAAAGNSSNNNDAAPSYPASYDIPNIVSVAAIDNRDKIASFSNYGRTKVHVAAPGVNIYSTVKDEKYASFSGTSMACPHVAGMAALLLSANPEMSVTDLKARLIQTSSPIFGLRKKVFAKGRVDMMNMIDNYIPPSFEPNEADFRDFDYTLESDHPYLAAQNKTYTVTIPGAKYIRVFFEKVDTEKRYDYVSVKDGTGEESEQVSGMVENYMTDYVLGDTLKLQFKTDASVNKWGFKISKLQVIY